MKITEELSQYERSDFPLMLFHPANIIIGDRSKFIITPDNVNMVYQLGKR